MTIILIFLLSITLLIPFIITCVILIYLLKHFESFGGDTGTLLIAAAIAGSGLCCLAYSFELLVPDLSGKLVLSFIRYIGNLVFIVSSFFYCIWFTDLWTRISVRIKWLIFLPSLLGLIVIATNPLHHLYYPDVSLVSYYGFPQMLHLNGVLYYPVQIYALGLIIITATLFIRWKTQSPRAYGTVVMIVFCGFLTPLIGYLIYLAGFRSFGFLNVMPYFLFITSLFFVAAVFKYKLFSIKPIAHQMVIDSLPAGVILLDNFRRIIEINPAAAHLLTLNGKTSLGRQISEVFSEDDPVIPVFSIESGSQIQIKRNGRDMLLTLSFMKGSKDEKVGFLLLIIDNTHEKEAEREVRKTTKLMSSTFDSIHDGILVVGTDRTIIAVNKEFWNIWDIPKEMRDTVDELVLLTYVGDKVRSPKNFTAEVNALTIEESEDEQIITLKSGKIIERYSVPLFVDGSLIGRIWSFHDLTELKKRELALLESEARYKLIMENAADLIWTLTPEGIFSYVSPSWTRIIGYPVDATIGLDFRQFVHPDDIPLCEVYLTQSILTRERQPDAEYRVLHTNGIWHWHSAASVPIYDNEGNFSALIGISRDISEKKMADQALRQSNRQLNLLTSITRHDILNLVMVALAYIDFSEEISKEARISEYLKKLRDVVVTIQDQIEFTQVYENLGSQSPQWQQIRSLIQTNPITPGITYSMNCPDVSVYADPLLRKVFENLIDNSIRHGEHVTDIRISCKYSSDGFIILYEDDGMGVITEDKGKIFVRGFGKNTGLGLFLVREILSMTGITIQETGERGKGVRFEIQVPSGGYRIG